MRELMVNDSSCVPQSWDFLEFRAIVRECLAFKQPYDRSFPFSSACNYCQTEHRFLVVSSIRQCPTLCRPNNPFTSGPCESWFRFARSTKRIIRKRFRRLRECPFVAREPARPQPSGGPKPGPEHTRQGRPHDERTWDTDSFAARIRRLGAVSDGAGRALSDGIPD